jgi:hypothetical protein
LPERVISHEIGHFIDFIANDPELRTWARGNALGHLATMYDYGKDYLPNMPGGKGEVTEAEKAEFRREAKRLAGEDANKIIDEEITETLPVDLETVAGILGQSMENMREKYPELYEYIARMSNAEKKALAIKILRDKMVPEDLKKFEIKKTVKTGEQVFRGRHAGDTQAKFDELLREEIKKRRLIENAVVVDELKRVTHKWSPFNAETSPEEYVRYRYSQKELYAEAMSVFFNDPELLMELAPTWSRGFFNWASEKKEFTDAYEAWQNDLEQNGIGNRTERRLSEMFAEGEKQKEVQEDERAARILANANNLWPSFVKHFFDSRWPVIKQVAKAVANGMQMTEENNPILRLERMIYAMSGSGGRAYLERFAKLYDDLKKNGLTMLDLNLMAFEERIAYDEGRQKLGNPLGTTPEIALKALDELQKRLGAEKFAKLREILNQFRANRRKYIIDPLLDSGMLSPQAAKTIGENEVYVTFKVLSDALDKNSTRLGPESISAHIFRQTGTLFPVENVIEATLYKDLEILKAVRRLEAWRSYKKFIARAIRDGQLDPEDAIEETEYEQTSSGKRIPKKPNDPLKDLVNVEEAGRLRSYIVSKDIAEQFKRDNGTMKPGMRILSIANFLPRQFFVQKNPGYIGFNIIRDYQRLHRNLPGMNKIPFSDIWKLMPLYIKSIPDAMSFAFGKPTQEILDMLDRDQLISVQSWRGLDKINTDTERLLAKYTNTGEVKEKVYDKLAAGLNLIEKLAYAAEVVPKLTAKRYLEKNTDWSAAKVDDFIRKYAGSPPFLIGGEDRIAMSNVLLFSNAILQGWRYDMKRLQEAPADVIPKLIYQAILPKAIMWLFAKGFFNSVVDDDDPEWLKRAKEYFNELQQFYRDISAYDMANYTIVPIPGTKRPDGTRAYLRMPTDEFSRFWGGIAQKAFAAADPDDYPGEVAAILNYMGGQLPNVSPAISAFGQGIIQGTVMGQNPYDAFRGENAIDPDIQKRGGYRRNRDLAIWIMGKYFGQSAESAAKGTFSLGEEWRSKDKIPLSTSTKNVEGIESFLEAPFGKDLFGRFVKYTSGKGEAERQAWQGKRSSKKYLEERIHRTEMLASVIRKMDEAPKDLSIVGELYEKWYAKPAFEKNEEPKINIQQFYGTFKSLLINKFADPVEKAILFAATAVDEEARKEVVSDLVDRERAKAIENRKKGKPYLTESELESLKANYAKRMMAFYKILNPESFPAPTIEKDRKED